MLLLSFCLALCPLAPWQAFRLYRFIVYRYRIVVSFIVVVVVVVVFILNRSFYVPNDINQQYTQCPS